MIDASSKFHLSRAEGGVFAADGLRPFFEYRDLGIAAPSEGKFHAHVIRAKGAADAHTGRHYHELDFQMVFILKGWVKFEYEGVGEVTLRPGDCVYQPPGIRHSELGHSEDLELLEITSPARFATKDG